VVYKEKRPREWFTRKRDHESDLRGAEAMRVIYEEKNMRVMYEEKNP
jgi:hypothetical protein